MRAAHFAPLLVVLTTCGGSDGNGITDPDDDVGIESFEVSFSGALSGTFEGTARFASAPSAGFGLLFAADGGAAFMSVIRPNIGRPGTGNFTIVEYTLDEIPPNTFMLTGTQGNTTFSAISGTVTITSSSGEKLAGTIQFQAMTGDGEQASGQVTFDARCVSTGTSACN